MFKKDINIFSFLFFFLILLVEWSLGREGQLSLFHKGLELRQKKIPFFLLGRRGKFQKYGKVSFSCIIVHMSSSFPLPSLYMVSVKIHLGKKKKKENLGTCACDHMG